VLACVRCSILLRLLAVATMASVGSVLGRCVACHSQNPSQLALNPSQRDTIKVSWRHHSEWLPRQAAQSDVRADALCSSSSTSSHASTASSHCTTSKHLRSRAAEGRGQRRWPTADPGCCVDANQTQLCGRLSSSISHLTAHAAKAQHSSRLGSALCRRWPSLICQCL
jgi:hypothetical protein